MTIWTPEYIELRGRVRELEAENTELRSKLAAIADDPTEAEADAIEAASKSLQTFFCKAPLADGKRVCEREVENAGDQCWQHEEDDDAAEVAA